MEKPTFQQRLKDVGLFLWNHETKEFLGRGGRSWVEIGIFYFVFYGCLTGFFIATIAVFYETIDQDSPRLQGDSSLLRGNPGMGYLPMPIIESTLIRVTNDPDDIQAYENSTKEQLQDYRNPDALDSVNCSGIDKPRVDGDKPCQFSFSELTQECNENNNYGFSSGQPCVLLKLNKIFGWTPNPWSVDEVQTVSRIPESIKSKYTPDLIWVDCHGENPADKDNLGTVDDIEYFPRQGFPVAFYPYRKQKDYRAPLVFVKFNNVTKHVGIMIECVAFDRNIELDKTEKQGSVHFELMVDVYEQIMSAAKKQQQQQSRAQEAEIGLFYLVYYACLTGFFAATIAVFYETIDADNPRLQGTSSLLKANPGMGFKPMPDIDTTLVHSKINGEHQKLYIENIKKVLDTYQNQNFKNEDCSHVKTPRVKEDTACEFNYTALTSQCNEANAFGMAENKPCVLLKLNKIYGWVPEVWSKEEAATAGLPEQIKKNYTDDRIWIDCHGENPADWDNLGDEDDIQYFPQQGFPLAFFPYKKQMNYRSPLVFVKFNKVTPHVGIMVECKALAKNIEVDRTEKEGSVHFELLVDN
ncbi:uncharacterized protein LOC106064913 [Biomphalaria glabrata]|uniref:Uncharacterized protein LOC106064913 n=1 Tax=Biomphalaria glabrata TaxID=6526 RepID=A0A9W2Z1V7_BIOGL|nr:uncharacterized protein LOC106064913 [Biomphalaria glabrata]